MDYFTWQQKDAGKTEYETFQAKNGQNGTVRKNIVNKSKKRKISLNLFICT